MFSERRLPAPQSLENYGGGALKLIIQALRKIAVYYDFMTLSPRDFEALSADLLSKALDQRFEVFKPGPDLGIDLRHVLSSGPIIVQCKRYSPHKFNELLRSLENERENLRRIKPSRYIVSTTVSLSPANKERIVFLLSPWINSTQDILGADDLNMLLRIYPEVIGAHFKLWISSTAVLERVLNARVFAHTEATLDATKRYAGKLVIHAGLNRALDLLRERHHLMVVGNPGIGKTTLARMLMCRFLEDGFEPVWIVGNIDDAWSVIHSAVGSDRKFVVVYDDFLGRVRFDDQKFGKNEDVSLLSLIERAANLPNLRLIMTTREYILADARRLHGAFNSRANDIVKYTLSLGDYARKERAQILFNHLYFSNLPDSRLDKLVKSRAYNEVIAHPHFNPRVVESVSDYANTRALTDDEYLNFFREEFENPSKLWDYPFCHEISPMAQQVLVILWSFSGRSELGLLEKATRIMNRDLSGPRFGMDFQDALRQLEGNFVVSNRYSDPQRRNNYFVVEFHNPSVEDFVETVARSSYWIKDLISACVTMDQVAEIWRGLQRLGGDGYNDLVLALRMQAKSCATSYGGRLINFQRWDEAKAVRTWSTTEFEEALALKILLELEQATQLKDLWHAELCSRVLTVAGWGKLLEEVPRKMSAAFSIGQLQSWIVHWSNWSQEEIELAERCLRSAVIDFFEKDNALHIEIGSIRVLMDAACLCKKGFSANEISSFLKAVKESVQTILENGRDALTLEDEREVLISMEGSLNISLADEIELLHQAALSQCSDDESSEVARPRLEARRFDEGSDILDVDALFKGLTDR